MKILKSFWSKPKLAANIMQIFVLPNKICRLAEPLGSAFLILPFKMSAVYSCTCVVAACLQIFTKHWRALAVFHFESSGAKQMSDSDKTLINILWDGARLEKQFDENPYSLSTSQLNILQMRKKFWQTFDPQREVSLQ